MYATKQTSFTIKKSERNDVKYLEGTQLVLTNRLVGNKCRQVVNKTGCFRTYWPLIDIKVKIKTLSWSP